VFLEIKADATKKLTVSESAAKKMYGYYWWRIETLDDALTALGLTATAAALGVFVLACDCSPR